MILPDLCFIDHRAVVLKGGEGPSGDEASIIAALVPFSQNAPGG